MAANCRAGTHLQHIAADGLLRFAEEHDAVLRLEQHPGEFVSPGTPLAFANRALDDAGIEALRALFAVGDFRTADKTQASAFARSWTVAMQGTLARRE